MCQFINKSGSIGKAIQLKLTMNCLTPEKVRITIGKAGALSCKVECIIVESEFHTMFWQRNAGAWEAEYLSNMTIRTVLQELFQFAVGCLLRSTVLRSRLLVLCPCWYLSGEHCGGERSSC
jgi:hypothetical protein